MNYKKRGFNVICTFCENFEQNRFEKPEYPFWGWNSKCVLSKIIDGKKIHPPCIHHHKVTNRFKVSEDLNC